MIHPATSAAAGALGLLALADPAIASAEATSIRPFTYHAPQAALDDLRRRVAATLWPEKDPVTDPSQGVQLATIQKVARYWAKDYDWRKVEAILTEELRVAFKSLR